MRGFDISESALRLAALALYITAIELNASPRPPQALKFPRNLRGEVLCRFGGAESQGKKAFPLGSLGPEVSPDFDKTFDIVIGNPPWTRLRDDKDEDGNAANTKASKSATDALNKAFTAIGRRVLTARGLDDLAKRFQNPDKNPDLPFLWRATEWAKDGGVIALAMPARLFGRTSGKGFEAWRAVLRSVEVTGLINGADLAVVTRLGGREDAVLRVLCTQRKAWRQNIASTTLRPFTNPSSTDDGRFRLDYEAANPISAARVEKQPWLLKTLSLGTWLDVEVMEALSNVDNKTLEARWAEWDAAGVKTGQGYNRSPDLAQKFVDFLGALPVFEEPTEPLLFGFTATKTYAELFGKNSRGQSSAHMPRREELYQPPLVIIPQAPGDDPYSPKAYLSTQAVAFSQSYYGYSCAGHPEEQTLASLIFLLAHSTLFRYFALMVSVSQGADRMMFTKQDFDTLPFPDIAKIPPKTKTTHPLPRSATSARR